MPLHLLGKKSWNVYNTDNIVKVRQDEAAAQAREEAEEQRMQEVDAERRIKILRGLQAPPPPPTAPVEDEESGKRGSHGGVQGRERKRRKLPGEDDTDYAIRVAKEEQQSSTRQALSAETQIAKRVASNDAPITDHAGHINLFPAPSSRHHVQKNAEAEAEAAKKKREFEDQYTMRFSNAAGFKQDIGAKPWYSSLAGQNTDGANGEMAEGAVGRDVWGNEDPRRKEREKMRVDASDPLMAIRQGVEGLRAVERERKKWKEEREREARELKELGERERRRKKRRKGREEEELEGFSLDVPTRESREEHRIKGRCERESTSSHRDGHPRSRNRSMRHESSHRHSSKRNSTKDHDEERRRRHRKQGVHRHNSDEDVSSPANDSKVRFHRERDKSERRQHAKTAAFLDKATADGRPGWEPGSGGRYSSQFAMA
ncbi:MAG: hypothetical protein M1830_006835 [Pleopsidium flavum]|nr:MAG: hypothetical protein M1830_006835 [Pleopsidium flavum]